MFDDVVAFVKVISSSIATEADQPVTLYSVTGIGGLEGTEADDDGEQGQAQEVFTALGDISRPLPPDGDVFLEAMAFRTADGLIPFAFRDIRLHRQFPNPAPGTIGRVHYGGGFHTMDLSTADTTIHTIYAPYEFDAQGVPQKAHAIVIDTTPGNESVVVTHGKGHALAMRDDDVVLRVDAETYIEGKPGEWIFRGTKLFFKGNCFLGASAETGLPLLFGPASPASPSVFVSPV